MDILLRKQALDVIFITQYSYHIFITGLTHSKQYSHQHLKYYHNTATPNILEYIKYGKNSSNFETVAKIISFHSLIQVIQL